MTDGSAPHHSFTRRQLFAVGGVGIAVGAIGTEIANLATQPSSTAAGADPPDVDLMQEHGVLKRVLLVYQECIRRINIGQTAPLPAIQAGAEIIHDFIEEFHEALEEGYVFPLLRKAGLLVSTVDTLLVQHARGRQLTQLILAGSRIQPTTTSNTERVNSAMAAFVRMYQ